MTGSCCEGGLQSGLQDSITLPRLKYFKVKTCKTYDPFQLNSMHNSLELICIHLILIPDVAPQFIYCLN